MSAKYPYRAIIFGEEHIIKGWRGRKLITNKTSFLVRHIYGDWQIHTARFFEIATIKSDGKAGWLINGKPLSLLEPKTLAVRLAAIPSDEQLRIAELKNLIATKTGSDPKPSGSGFIGRCPAHEDKNANLSFSQGNDALLLKCHAGCTFKAITAALGIKTAELFYKDGTEAANQPVNGQKRNMVATYPYHDAGGKLRFEVCRYDPKGFAQRQPDPAKPDKWIWNLKSVELVPYRLPELITAVKAGEAVFIAEGEKDVAALVANGFKATCNAAGAGKWQDAFAGYFDGASFAYHG